MFNLRYRIWESIGNRFYVLDFSGNYLKITDMYDIYEVNTGDPEKDLVVKRISSFRRFDWDCIFDYKKAKEILFKDLKDEIFKTYTDKRYLYYYGEPGTIYYRVHEASEIHALYKCIMDMTCVSKINVDRTINLLYANGKCRYFDNPLELWSDGTVTHMGISPYKEISDNVEILLNMALSTAAISSWSKNSEWKRIYNLQDSPGLKLKPYKFYKEKQKTHFAYATTENSQFIAVQITLYGVQQSNRRIYYLIENTGKKSIKDHVKDLEEKYETSY